MTKQSAAWMPLYIGDYLGDTQRLTTEQHGAYLLLILDYWRNGPAPDDDGVLQQITKLERAAWKKHRPALARLFQIADGEWRHKRIDKELASAADNAERRSSKAKAAAQARWGDAPSNAQSMPEAMLGACPPPSPSPSPNGDIDDVVRADARAEPDFPSDLIAITDEVCRAAGVRHVDPGRIIEHQKLVREWIDEGLDPQTHMIPAIRAALANHPDTIHSLKWFAQPVRQFRARQEAHANGHRADKSDLRRGTQPSAALALRRQADAELAALGSSDDQEDHLGSWPAFPAC